MGHNMNLISYMYCILQYASFNGAISMGHTTLLCTVKPCLNVNFYLGCRISAYWGGIRDLSRDEWIK